MEKLKGNNEAPDLNESEVNDSTRFPEVLSELLRERHNLTRDTFPTLLGDLESLAKRYQERGAEEAAEVFGHIQDFRKEMMALSIQEQLDRFKELLENLASTDITS